MARIVPSDISALALAGAHAPELETLILLRDGLPTEYTVFHGVHWTREYQGFTVYGEIDFAVVNKAGEILLIEQKNGRLEETEDGLVKVYGKTSKNVGDQIKRSIDNVREKFGNVHGRGRRLNIDYLIFCPDYRVVSVNAAALDSSRIVDAGARDALAKRIHALLGPGKKPNKEWTRVIESFFRQSFEVAPDIHAHIDQSERRFTRLSGGLAEVIRNIHMDPLRLRVQGTAGSGKTIVAREVFDAAIERGHRPLLVCFNRPLAERIKALARPEGLVVTFHGLCDPFLKSRGQVLDYGGIYTDPNFWHGIQERVMGEVIDDDWRFDTLIIDEGQDFDADWFEIIRLFTTDKADMVWLEDLDQNIHGTLHVPLDDFVIYRARANYRSPQSIARFLARHLPFEFDPANDLPGLGVGVHRYGVPEDQPKRADRLVQGLLDKGFAADQITVLTCMSRAESVFNTVDTIGGLPVRRFANRYDELGNQVMTPGKLRFESINRYKGQQTPAVILTDVDPRAESLEQDLRRLFCSMTRASVRLEVLARKDNPLTADYRPVS